MPSQTRKHAEQQPEEVDVVDVVVALHVSVLGRLSAMISPYIPVSDSQVVPVEATDFCLILLTWRTLARSILLPTRISHSGTPRRSIMMEQRFCSRTSGEEEDSHVVEQRTSTNGVRMLSLASMMGSWIFTPTSRCLRHRRNSKTVSPTMDH